MELQRTHRRDRLKVVVKTRSAHAQLVRHIFNAYGLVETGKVNEHTAFADNDICARIPRFAPEAMKATQVLVDLIAESGAQKGATPAPIALAWLLAQKPWVVPIPGSRKLERLDENIGAAALELTPDDLQEIESALSQITIQGDRYPKDLDKMTNR